MKLITRALCTLPCALLAISTAYAAPSNGLVVAVAKQANITEAQAHTQIDQVMEALKVELNAGREVTIKNFGKFYVSQVKAHQGRNPRTGAPIQIEAKRYPRFVSSDNFKEEMNPKAVKEVALVASQQPVVDGKAS